MTAFIAAILITLGGACVTAEFIQQWSQTDASEALGVVYDQHSDGVITIGSKRIAQTSNSDALCALFRASTGALIWQKEIHMNTNDRATAAVADVESIFVVGTGQGGTQSGSFAVKLNKTDGSFIWSVQTGGSGSVNRNAKAVALSNNGSLLFLAGSLCDSGVQLDGAKCYAYVETLRVSTGASVGVHKFGPGNADEVRAVGVDSSGGLYLAGRTKGALSNLHSEAVAAQNGQYDYFLVKMSAATGAIQWSQQGKGTANDMANSLVIYSNFVYITGVSYHLSLPFAFWSSFDLSDGSRRDDFNGLAGEAHSIVITPGLQGVDGPFITGQDGSQLFVHKYQLGRKTVAKHSVAANAGKTLGGGYSALVTAVDGGGIIAKAIALGGTQTATSTAEKSYVVQRLELINNCSASICGQNGDCIDLIDDFQCRCHAGYEGESCENEIDECQTNQCQNMGSCLDGIASYTCVCTPGFTGVHCEVDIDDCVPNPCVNGSCNDLVTDFHCICDSGWEGKTCAKNIDDCRGISCGPGVCHDLLAAYTCTCPAGFSGQHCEINIDDCASNPCMNGGQCVDGIDSYTCMCLSGTSPPNCVDDVNECLPSPCLNEGVCTPGIGTFTCKCKQGYVGQRCEAAAGHCDSNPCQNGGKCSVLASGFYCTCPRGFKGRMCENQMPTPCQLSPCQNEGTCFATTTESFTCTCRDPYTGPTCNEIDITALSNADVTSTNAEDVAQSFNKAAQDPSTLEVNDISNFAKLTSKLFGVGDLSHVAIDNTFDALSSLLGTPTEVLDAAHNRDNSSAMLSQSLETFGEHVLRPEMERTEISKGNIALTAELFKHQLPSSGHYLTFQIIGKRTLPESESLSLSPISGINSIKTQPKQQVYGILQLPKSLLSDITTAKPFVLNTVAFRDSRFFPGLLPVGSVVNSLVLSVRLNSSSTRHLREPVTFSLRLEAHLSNVTRPQCVWWDYTAYNKKGNWSTAGCTTLLSSLTKDGHVYVNCSCTHLTNFAVVIRAPTDTAQSDSKDDKNERVLHYITLTFGPLSMLSLGVTIFLILTIKILRENQAMQIVLNLCLALLLTLLFFVMGIERSSNTNWCRASAILIHFFALSSFAWMLIEGVNFYLHMVRVFSYRSKKIVLKYAIFGWGVPLLIVLAAIVTDVRSDGGVYVRDDVCWISSKGWFYGSFIAPVCLVLLVNIIIFVMLAKVIRSTQSGIQEKNARVRKLKILCAVAILMGFPWLFLAFAWGDQRVIFDYLFTIFATLQGFIIFLFNIFFNREVQNIICAAHLKGVRKVAKASKKQLEDMESMGSACDSISSSGEYLFHQDSSPPRRSFLSWFFKSSKSSPNSDFSVSTMSTSVASNSLNSSLSRKNSHKSSADSTKILVPKRRDSKTVMKDKQEVCRPAANESPMSEFSMAPLPTDAFSDLPYAHVNTKFYEKSDGRGGESV